MNKALSRWLTVIGLSLLPLPLLAQQQYVWENVSLGLMTSDLTALTILPDDPNVVLVGGSGMVFRTDDAGDTWRMVLRIGSASGRKSADTGSDGEADDDGRLEEETEQIYRDLYEDVESKYGTAYADSIASQLKSQADEQAEDQQQTRRKQAGLKRADAASGADDRDDRRIRRIVAVSSVPGLVFICTERGLYESRNGGVRFNRVALPLGGKHRVIEDVLYLAEGTTAIATAAGVVVRLQNGQTYLSSMPTGNQPVHSLLWHRPSARIFAGTNEGILVSSDFGSTFRTLYVPMSAKSRRINDMTSPGFQPQVILAASEQGLIRSTDGGETFEPTWTARLGTSNVRRLSSVSMRQDMHVATPKGIFRTPNAGSSLVELSTGLTDHNVRAVSSRVFGGKLTLWIATSSGAFRYVPRLEVKVSRKIWLLLGKHQLKDPPLTRVMDQATNTSHLSMELGSSMERNVRLRSLAPRVRFDHGRAYERNENKLFPVDPFVPFLGERVTVVPGETDTRIAIYLELRDLIFDPQEPLVETYRRQVRKKRGRLRRRIAKLYMARHRLLLQLLGNRKKSGRTFRKRLHRFETISSILDALTGYRLTWPPIDRVLEEARSYGEEPRKVSSLRDPKI
jgi:photosystem II stability/assembly factor-like uncharacterized protein